MIRAVTFDYWNTLVFEPDGYLNDRRVRAWTDVLASAGRRPDAGRIAGAIGAAWQRLAAAWEANESYHAADAAAHAVETLGEDLTAAERDALIAEFLGAADGADLRLADGIEGCLRALKEAGARLGIVCDVGFTPSPLLRAFLDRRGLMDFFDHWSFSDEVGSYKPFPEIFRHALDGLGVEAHVAAHVGDRRRTDVAGALATGMTAVRYAGVYEDPPADGLPEAPLVVRRHADLPAALGLGAAGSSR